MNFIPPPSKLVERVCNGSYEYVLTVNDIVAVCPFKAPVPHQENGHPMTFAFSACGSSCPLFSFDSEPISSHDVNEKKQERLFIHLACGNANSRHPIQEVVYMPKVKEDINASQNVVEVEGENFDTPPTGKVFKL